MYMCVYFYLHVCKYKDACLFLLCMIDSVCVLVFLISEPPPYTYTSMDTCFVCVPSISFSDKENPCLYISVVTYDSLY